MTNRAMTKPVATCCKVTAIGGAGPQARPHSTKHEKEITAVIAHAQRAQNSKAAGRRSQTHFAWAEFGVQRHPQAGQKHDHMDEVKHDGGQDHTNATGVAGTARPSGSRAGTAAAARSGTAGARSAWEEKQQIFLELKIALEQLPEGQIVRPGSNCRAWATAGTGAGQPIRTGPSGPESAD